MGTIRRTPADAAFSDAIRHRDGWRCRYCARPYGGPHPGLHCAHVIHGRRTRSTRFMPENAMALCYSCHKWTVEHPVFYVAWLGEELGQAIIDRVNNRYLQHVKSRPSVIKEIARHYRAELKRMESSGVRDLAGWPG